MAKARNFGICDLFLRDITLTQDHDTSCPWTIAIPAIAWNVI